MTLKSKICGVSDSKTLNFLINYKYPPQFIGFIANYPKSKRYVEFDKLKFLIDVKRKNSYFVAVLVKPDEMILEKLKKLNFDYFQIYNCTPSEIELIKDKYKTKIITAIKVNKKKDVDKYKEYLDVTDIFLFDSDGMEKSLSFNHEFIKNLNLKKEIMLAGNIQIDDQLEDYNKIANIIDISGGLETSGLKDILKIEAFLNKIEKINNET
tara:strand:- start:2887 stop:3516 length:630 start_codon:yes stop_codon:yes gene_type:complete